MILLDKVSFGYDRAEDRFISAAFGRRLTRRAALGGLVGAALGCGALALLPRVEGGARLAMALRPHGAGWLALGLGVPLAGAPIAWVAARISVRLALARMP